MVKRTVFFLVLVLSLVFAVSAAQPQPHQFYGHVSINGSAIPNGYYLDAKINGNLVAECPIVDGSYGYTSLCILNNYELSVSTQTIIFSISDLEVGQAPFEERGITKLDFNLTRLPSISGTLSNGVCEVDLGECSTNSIDCDISKTTACIDNGVCDTGIGETCVSSPGDCGVCPPVSSGSSGGGGGGSSGGGGGGSSGGGSTVTSLSTSTGDGDTNSLGGSLNGTGSEAGSNTNAQKGFFGGLTGAVIGTLNSGTLLSLLFILIVLVGVGVILFVNKKSPKNAEE